MDDFKDLLNVSRISNSSETTKNNLVSQLNQSNNLTPSDKKNRKRAVLCSTDSLMPVVPTLRFTNRKVATSDSKWVFTQFTNPARTDGLKLFHWERATTRPGEYPFAQFNKKQEILKYTEEEYEQYFKDKNWTKEETDHLFDLCERFDLRFIVIHDRFESTRKTVDDLKERYYKIEKELWDIRNKSTPETKRNSQNPLANFNFEKKHEQTRKKQLDLLLRLNRHEVKEMETLITEQKKIESNQKKKSQERKRVLKLTDSVLSSPTNTSSSPSPPPTPPQKRKRKDSSEETGTVIVSRNTKKERGVGGTFVRSTKMWTQTNASTKTLRKIDQTLDRLGIRGKPMATEAICNNFQELRQEIIVLLDLQSHVEKKKYELQLLRAQKEQILKQSKNSSMEED